MRADVTLHSLCGVFGVGMGQAEVTLVENQDLHNPSFQMWPEGKFPLTGNCALGRWDRVWSRKQEPTCESWG
ncbi:MAG: hypothetical protein ACE5OY_02290 [Candidatus Bathyarchaeia archaeon]